jgi:hypothetical protein
MNRGIELPVFQYSDETAVLAECGVDYEMSKNDIGLMTFFNIDAIAPYIDGEKQYCTIHVNGTEYIAAITYKKLRKLIWQTWEV